MEILEKAKIEAEAKALELSAKYGKEITPFVFIINEDPIIGYMQEPDRLSKMRAIDMYEASRTQAGDVILRTGLLQAESDKRILDENSANDAIYLGAIDFATKFVKIASEQLKKK
jgi:hypothetical protein